MDHGPTMIRTFRSLEFMNVSRWGL
uniref:Uncharacterized protein n=1 Tax=Physcomitrium patens TaxID=3218 RepID=A0A7I4DR24_PHYPA